MMVQDWDHPDWEHQESIHEWKNYVSTEVMEIWESFTDAQKMALSKSYDETAENEELH